MEAVVMAAGEGTRLLPLTERWAKPVLPIDGLPVLATLVRELRAAGCERLTVVTRPPR
jgi:MurNAc alpha-1-phosphate uridylyltransferase